MLTMTKVLDYVKRGLGYPYIQIEISDTEITDYIKKYTLLEFSYYVPQVRKLVLDTDDTSSQVPAIQNEFYLTEPDNLEILNVIEIYTNSSGLIMTGHPPFGPFSLGEVREWALQVEVAGMLRQYSSFGNYTFEFRHPNVIRISPTPGEADQYFTIEYERSQPQDLSGIPNDLQQIFNKLALADIKIILGTIRKKYEGNLRSPFGEIPISSDIGNEGRDEKDKIIDKLETTSMPNVIIDFG